MTDKKALLSSVGVNLFFLVLCLVFGDLQFGAIDDFFMARILEGVYGNDYNVHLTFVNVLFGYALLPFYHLFPKIGWYYVAEMASVFIALTSICFVFLRRFDKGWGWIASVLFVAAVASDYYLVLQFTQCASVLSAAGILLIWTGFDKYLSSEKKWKANAILAVGAMLFLWGSMMRFEAFLMGTPFFALMLLSYLKKEEAEKKRLFLLIGIISVAVFGCLKINQMHYESPDYKNYMDFQGPRAVFGDGRNYNDQAIYEDLEEMGLRGTDFGYLKAWSFYDNKVFSLENIAPIMELVKKYTQGLNPYYLPGNLLGALTGAGKAPIFLLWVLFCVAAFASNRKNLKYAWLSLFCVLVAFTYLLYVDRLVYRVENGLWLYASIFVASKVDGLPKISLKLLYCLVLVIAVTNVLAYGMNGTTVRSVNSGNSVEIVNKKETIQYQDFFDYVDGLGDNALVLLPHNQYMELSFHREPVYLAAEKGSWKKFIPMGFWTPKFPDIENHIQSVGVTNPFENVVKKNVYVVDDPHLGPFLKNHYNYDVKCEKVKDFNGMVLLKYSLVEDSLK